MANTFKLAELQNCALLMFVVAFLILLHQVLLGFPFFEIKDIHHETFAVGFASAAVALLFAKRYLKKG
jgi:hypothetical protein